MLGKKNYFFIISLIIELFVLLGWFFNFEITNIVQAKYIPVPFYIFYIVAFGITLLLFYPKELRYYLKNFLNKYCLSDTAIKNYKTDEDLEGIQDKIILPKKESSITVQEIQDATPKKEKDEFSKIFKHMDAAKYELVISEIQTKLANIKDEKKEFLCRLILYYAYIDCQNDAFLDDAIDNLKHFIPLAKKYEKDVYWEARYNIMVAYAKQNNFDMVKQENCNFINEIYRDSKVSADTKMRCYRMQATIYLKENNIPYAMGYFEKASLYDENNYEILFNMALVYYYTERNIDKCLECIDKIDRVYIQDKEQFRLLIVMQYYCLSLKKQYKDAYDIINGYHLSEHNLPMEMKAHKAYIAYKMNFYEEAKKLSNEILSVEYNPTATNVRAMLQIEDGLYEAALHNFTRIMQDFKENEEKYYLSEIYYNRSYVNLKLDNVKEAINDFNQAKALGFIDFCPNYIVELDIAQTKFLKNS